MRKSKLIAPDIFSIFIHNRPKKPLDSAKVDRPFKSDIIENRKLNSFFDIKILCHIWQRFFEKP